MAGMAEVWALAWQCDELGLDAAVLLYPVHAFCPWSEMVDGPLENSDRPPAKLLAPQGVAPAGHDVGPKPGERHPAESVGRFSMTGHPPRPLASGSQSAFP